MQVTSATVDVVVSEIVTIGFGLVKRFDHVRDTTRHSDVPPAAYNGNDIWSHRDAGKDKRENKYDWGPQAPG